MESRILAYGLEMHCCTRDECRIVLQVEHEVESGMAASLGGSGRTRTQAKPKITAKEERTIIAAWMPEASDTAPISAVRIARR